uniref:Uncharacterized protein n=1 Tax=Hyaloperonospora arabidopsidis (strain Emoy2) TaxID=559515 RepID=M4C2A3_HYAAE
MESIIEERSFRERIVYYTNFMSRGIVDVVTGNIYMKATSRLYTKIYLTLITLPCLAQFCIWLQRIL